MSNSAASNSWIGDGNVPFPSVNPYPAPSTNPYPTPAPWPQQLGYVPGLDPNPAHTAALLAIAAAFNRHAAALEKANQLQSERRSGNPSVFA